MTVVSSADAGAGLDIYIFNTGNFGDGPFGGYGTSIGVSDFDSGGGAEVAAPIHIELIVYDVESGTGADAANVPTETIVAADGGSGSGTEARAVAGTDTATGADGPPFGYAFGSGGFGGGSFAGGYGGVGSYIALSTSDTGAGFESGFLSAERIADYDTGFGLDSGYVFTESIASSDTGHGQDGDTESAADTDTATGVEAGVMAGYFPADTDQGFLSDYTYSVSIPVMGVSSSDSGRGEGGHFTSGPLADADSGIGVDFFGPPQVVVFDAGSGAEQLAYMIEVFPFPPAWLFAVPGGAYQLVWRPGTPEARELHRFESLSYGQLAEVAEIIERMRDADSLSLVSDADAAGGAESSSPTATIVQYVVSTRVTCSVPV
jgi:hypothetical protein